VGLTGRLLLGRRLLCLSALQLFQGYAAAVALLIAQADLLAQDVD
jgi:hypothetical protein